MSDEETVERALKQMEGETVRMTATERGGSRGGLTVIKIETQTVEFVYDGGEVRVRRWY